MTNDVLTQTLKLACLIRDSDDAIMWRQAWSSLSNISVDMTSLLTAPLDELPVAAHIRAIRVSEQGQSRPVMFPLLVMKPHFYKNVEQVLLGLKDYPQARQAFGLSRNWLRVIALIVEFLRSIGPGYPHENIVYTAPGTPWRELTSLNELPWGIGEPLLPKNVLDARLIGLDRLVPSVFVPTAQSLNVLVAAIQQCEPWLQLKRTFEKIEHTKNLISELDRIKQHFEKELQKINRPNIITPHWIDQVENLARNSYAKKGDKIGDYINAYLSYQQLIERIYWVLSQLVFYEEISSISSRNFEQLQQVSACEYPEPLITAISKVGAKTLDVGQIIQISLPETEHLLDGLYQIEHIRTLYEIKGGGPRILFRSRRLWDCKQELILKATKDFLRKTIVEELKVKGENEYKIEILDGNTRVASLQAGVDITEFEFVKTMYLI